MSDETAIVLSLASALQSLLPVATERNTGCRMLAEDPLYRHLLPDTAPALVTAAIAEGRSRAASVERLCGRNPYTAAAHLGVPVACTAEDASFGSTFVFAQYAAWPACITLHRPALDRIDRLLAYESIRPLLGIARCAPVFLAHELFHHLDRVMPERALSRRHRVSVVALGRWRWTCGLTSLDEIAAGAFAQSLLGLRFYPKLLEWLAVLALAPEKLADLVLALRGDRSVANESKVVA